MGVPNSTTRHCLVIKTKCYRVRMAMRSPELADDLVRSPDKLATENIFILTVEMHKKVAARSFIFTWVLS